MAKQATKALKSTAKVTRAAVRQGNKAAQQTNKAVRQTTRAVKALQAEQTSRPPGRFVVVDGVRVHYIARGKGRPVVLIHGNGTMAEDFVICGLVDQLAKRYRVIAIDRPGFGHTDRPRYRVWTAAAQAHLVHRVLERLKVERPVIVGHSWGTLVALALAVGGWRELRGLVLLSGYFYPTRRADVALSAPLAIPGVGDAARSMVPQAVGHLLAPAGGGRPHGARLQEAAEAKARYVQSVCDPNVMGLISRLCRMSSDYAFTPRMALRLARAARKSGLGLSHQRPASKATYTPWDGSRANGTTRSVR